jgi:hypothetical protein
MRWRRRLYAVEGCRLYAVEASTLSGGGVSTLNGGGIDSKRWRHRLCAVEGRQLYAVEGRQLYAVEGRRPFAVDRHKLYVYRCVGYIIGAVALIAFFPCCSLYRTIYRPRRRCFHPRRAICRARRAVRCASLFAPLMYAFALRSARCTSRCVGVPQASNASNAAYGRRVAPTQH